MGAIWRLALARSRMGRGAFRRREGSRQGWKGWGFGAFGMVVLLAKGM
jgi:hypothetical protein